MIKRRLTGIESMLLLSVCFTLFLIGFRILYWHQLLFTFYIWNLFLAVIPLLLSRQLHKWQKFNIAIFPLLFCWILFLPNAPYIITDIFHFYERPPVPKWFDLLLVTSAAFNGLMLGMVSLIQVEHFLRKHLSSLQVNLSMLAIILSCAYGVYLGRFLRFNSWDIFTRTNALFHQLAGSLVCPRQHVSLWAFTMFFGAMIWIVYYTIKKLPGSTNANA
jgi:uncharacterized membrane protein